MPRIFAYLVFLLSALNSNAALAMRVQFELQLGAPSELNSVYYPRPDTAYPWTMTGQPSISVSGFCDDVTFLCENTPSITSPLVQVALLQEPSSGALVNALHFNLADGAPLPLSEAIGVHGSSTWYKFTTGAADSQLLGAIPVEDYLLDAKLSLTTPVLPTAKTTVVINYPVNALLELSDGSPRSLPGKCPTSYQLGVTQSVYCGRQQEDEFR